MTKDENKLIEDGIKYFNYFKDRFGTTEFEYNEYYDVYVDALIKCAMAYVKKPKEFTDKYNFQYMLIGYYRGYLNGYRINKKRIFRDSMISWDKLIEDNYEDRE